MTNRLKQADDAAKKAARCLLLANDSNIPEMERVNFTLLAVVNTVAQTNLLLVYLAELISHPEERRTDVL